MKNSIEGLKKLASILKDGSVTEEQLLRGIAAMVDKRDRTGMYENWGFNAFANNYKTFDTTSKSQRRRLYCPKCDEIKVLPLELAKYERCCGHCGTTWERTPV